MSSHFKIEGPAVISMLAYASRTGTKRNLEALRRHDWRLIVSAKGVLRTEGFRYALDNGAWTAYSNGEAFDERAFLIALRKLGSDSDWTVIPDIVAGGHASLDLSLRWMRTVLDEAPRALIAVQDGMKPNDIREFLGARVGIFIGGSTEWKLMTLASWCDLARLRNCWVHVGRVNTIHRIRQCGASGATSFDGTSASRFAQNVPKLDAARRQGSLVL